LYKRVGLKPLAFDSFIIVFFLGFCIYYAILHIPQQIIAQSSAVQPAPFSTYENDSLGIKILYPSNWATNEGDNSVSFTSPSGNTPATYPVSLGIRVISFQGTGLHSPLVNFLDFYTNTIINFSEHTKKNFHLIESSATYISGIPSHMLIYTYLDPTNGSTEVRDIYTLKGDKAYHIGYYSSPENYYTYLGTIQKMVSTFEILTTEGNT
jgi:hypothetical protein